MVYVIYNNDTKIVKQINREEPTNVDEGYSIAISDVLNVGDEVTYQLIIYEIDENGKIVRYSGYKVAPNVRELLNEMSKKDAEIKTLKEQLSLTQQAIDEMIFNNGGAL